MSGLIGRLISALTRTDSLVGAIRLSGAFWMAPALGLFWLLLSELGIGRWQRAATISLMTASPLLVVSYSTVTSDNVTLASSAPLVLLMLRFEKALFPWWGLGLAALVVVGLESTNVLGVMACGSYLVVRSLDSRLLALRSAIVDSGLTLGAIPALTGLARTHAFLLQAHPSLDFALPHQVIHAAGPDPLTADFLLSRLGSLVIPTSRPYIP